LNIQFLLCLGVINSFLELEYLHVILVGLFGILVLSPLEIIIQLLDFLVQVFLLVSQAVKFSLGIEAGANVAPELPEGKIAHLCIQLF
jgi:hypothetical protein